MRTCLDYGMSASDYHRDPAWGSSSLKAMRRGPPARVMWEREHVRTSDAMALGTACHCALLTPAVYDRDYAVKPDGMSFSTRDGKAWREANTKPFIQSYEDSCIVARMLQAINEKPIVRASLDHSVAREVSLFWSQEGEPLKGRPDWIEGGYIYDLKMSRHAGSEMGFRAFMEGWMNQGAHYRTGAEACGLGTLGCRLVVIGSREPFYVSCYEIKPDALDLIAIENAQTVFALGQHRQANDWPGTPDAWTLIEPPASALIANTVLDNLPEEAL